MSNAKIVFTFDDGRLLTVTGYPYSSREIEDMFENHKVASIVYTNTEKKTVEVVTKEVMKVLL